MAKSICPKCENSGFEVKVNEPKGSNYKVYFVQCATCGTVVGVMDFWNIGARINLLAEKLGVKLK